VRERDERMKRTEDKEGRRGKRTSTNPHDIFQDIFKFSFFDVPTLIFISCLEGILEVVECVKHSSIESLLELDFTTSLFLTRERVRETARSGRDLC
jgi:hypothetical protein